MATDYLEKYVESVSDLPAQLQRKFRLIRDLDEKSAKLQVGGRQQSTTCGWTVARAQGGVACVLAQPNTHAACHLLTRRPTSTTSAASS